jgi:CubicO group peptidase (beta-lactamase class C family)
VASVDRHFKSVRRFAGILACAWAAVFPPALCVAGEDDRSLQLQEVLAAYNEEVRAPAWAAAVVRNDAVVAVAGVGVRDIQGGVPLDVATDQFHWGSVSKSVTATMIAGVVADGALSWNTPLSKAFAGIPMRAEYRDVTIAQLLNHRADLPAYTLLGPPEARRFQGYTGTPVQRRDAFVREVLQEAPPARPDNNLVYSNAGLAVAAHAAEIATGKSWEELVRQYVFDRIGMKSAGFGLPASIGDAQTRGHAGRDAGTLNVMGAGPQPGSPVLDAAGNIRSTVGDLALYARAHLLGLKGRQGPLEASAVRALHTPLDDGRTLGQDGNGYAMGWGLRREGGQLVHWHNGSAGQYFAQVDIFPDDDLAIVVMCNAGFPGRGVPELVRRIRGLYVR